MEQLLDYFVVAAQAAGIGVIIYGLILTSANRPHRQPEGEVETGVAARRALNI